MTPRVAHRRRFSQASYAAQPTHDPSLGAGLANAAGEYNCFLNVVLQALFNCERFRERLLIDGGDHRCNGSTPEECVTCTMLSVFRQLKGGAAGAADPTALRRALDAAFKGTDLFRLAEMNDASETLQEIYNCLHRALAIERSRPAEPQAEQGAGGSKKKERNRGGKYEEEITGKSLVRAATGSVGHL